MRVVNVVILFLTFVACELNPGNAEEKRQARETSLKNGASPSKTIQHIDTGGVPNQNQAASMSEAKQREVQFIDSMEDAVSETKSRVKRQYEDRTTALPVNKIYSLLHDIIIIFRKKLGPYTRFSLRNKPLHLQVEKYLRGFTIIPNPRGRPLASTTPRTTPTTTPTTVPVRTAPPEQKVFKLPPNVYAMQSSNYYYRLYTADKAINGDKDPRYYEGAHPCAVTGRGKTPWWEVRFSEPTTIREVWLYSCGGQSRAWRHLADLTLTVDEQVCNTYDGPVPPGSTEGPSAIIHCRRPLTGKKLRITKQGKRMCLCEVEWF